MAENFGIGPGPHELKIGSSFTGGRGGTKKRRFLILFLNCLKTM